MQHEHVRRCEKRAYVYLLAHECHLTSARVPANQILAGATTLTIPDKNEPRGRGAPRHDGEEGRDDARDVLDRGKPPGKNKCHLYADSEPRPAVCAVTTMKVSQLDPDRDNLDPGRRYADTFAKIVLDALVNHGQRRGEPPSQTCTHAARARLVNVKD